MRKKIFTITLACVLILVGSVSAISIDKNVNTETKTLKTTENYEERVGYMSISPGTLEKVWEDYELTAEINPDFAGDDEKFSVKHNSVLTFTAEYEIKYDSMVLPEKWTFYLYVYGYKNGTLVEVENSYISIDDFDENDDDDKTTGTLSVDIKWDEYDQIVGNLTTSYWRPPWEGSKMEFGETQTTDIVILENKAPTTPTIEGTQKGENKIDYEYAIFSDDVENDKISYYIDWGDGSNSGWSDYYESGETFEISHNWSKKGNYEIKVKAKDDFNGKESNWAVMEVEMPKSKEIRNSFLEKIFDLFPRINEYLTNLNL